MFSSVDKFLISLFPLIGLLGGYLGFEVSPEWWQSVIAAVTPILVWAVPNK